MSLIRTAIILSVAVAAMPSDPESQKRLYDRTVSAVHWTLTFCDRNPDTCATAGTYWDAFLAKAEFAGQLAYQSYENFAASDPNAKNQATPYLKSRAVHRYGTLTQEDLRPNWRGPSRGQGI